ncbi:hypothetical protein B0H66DRAFT_61915 [Apodospora peruviana]|uniref:Nucleotide exchange factor SIL1 n=1 Tax=Apodospora peruviana TaxID=516989 RepID=A0AAE0ISE4_9PEZI|nr:hypothetical protein B0H66DRAFT_61915 [Apodospora peruviana]
MATLNLRRLPLSLVALIGLLLVSATATEDSAPSPSPSAEVELICHTDNPTECYPKIFQATNEFQIVRPDQDLPKGLHVRLNVQTGQKEAKINVPDELNTALEGLPVDSSVVVVEPEDQEAQIKIPPNAPAYDPAGKIKEPRAETQDEGNAFYKSLSILKKGLNVDEALEMLEDISHDIYYGLKIAEDYDTTKQLFCLANTGEIFTSTDDPSSSKVLHRAKLAALTISSAVQNNPKALSEIEKHWPALQKVRCPGTGSSSSNEPLGTATFRLVSGQRQQTNDPSLAKARVSAISGLLKNKAIRTHFLANGGMERLLDVLVMDDGDEEESSWEPAQRKAGLLVLDNFLDEDMGAVLGEWPTTPQAEDEVCAARTTITTELTGECWDWHAKKLADRHDKGHWSVELWNKLREQRKNINRGSKKQQQQQGKTEL